MNKETLLQHFLNQLKDFSRIFILVKDEVLTLLYSCGKLVLLLIALPFLLILLIPVGVYDFYFPPKSDEQQIEESMDRQFKRRINDF